MTVASRRLLVGRTIVGYDPRRGMGRGGVRNPRYRQVTHDPVIELDSGACLTFSVEETDHGEYGICCHYHPLRKP